MYASKARSAMGVMFIAFGLVISTHWCSLTFAKNQDKPPKPGGAELAFRWNPEEGGPKNIAEALKVLGLQGKTPTHYRVTYLTVERFPQQAGFCSIVRERVNLDKSEHELTFKLRGNAPLTASGKMQVWTCPIGASAEVKDEVDVAVLEIGEVKKYSRSCTLEAESPLAVPAGFGATLERHENTMVRVKADGNVLEEWHPPDGSVVLEVSAKGTGDTRQIASFRSQVAGKLIAAGAKASAGNKSESSAFCPD